MSSILPQNKKENPTKLLFFDNLESNKPTYNVTEIFFSKAVNIQQFRILKPDSNPHAKYKSMVSKTQKDIIYNFEIFGRNLKKIDDKFDLIFKCDNINKTNGETDSIFPLLQEFTTNHIVFRGKFEMITLCIYGTTCDNNENSILMEQARNDVPLEKINEKIQQKKNSQIEKNTLISKEEQSLIDKYPIENLMEGEGRINQFFKDENTTEKKDEMMNVENDFESLSYSETAFCGSFKEINYINKGNKNMIDKTKTGYIYYENDLKQIIDNLINFYNLDDKNISEQLILEHHINFKNLFIILEILIDRNKAHLEDDCVFNKKNLDIFSLIPNNIISIINNSLKGLKSGETEIKLGLKLLKYISNYQTFVDEFIKNNGMEQLYNIILMNNDHGYSNVKIKKEIMPSLFLKALALENIYKLLTFNSAYKKLVKKIDKNNFPIKEFLIKEPIKEKMSVDNLNGENEDEKDRKRRDRDRSRDRNREREREKERDRESRHKRRSKSRTESSSSSHSRYRSRSRSYNRKASDDSRMQRKDKRKNVPLKNGLQILSTLLISKKNILLTNIMKNITKKINLIQYLKNLNELINDYISPNSKKLYYLNRIQYHLQRIVNLIQKLDTPYRTTDSQSRKRETNLIDNDYPFKHYWIDYFDMDKKYFNKDIFSDNNTNITNNNSNTNNRNISSNDLDENYEQEYIIRNCLNKYNSPFENIIITNEISELFEQYDFYNNIIVLLSCPEIQSTSIFYSLSIQIKNIISLICLNTGGINYLSKNYENTSILINLISKILGNFKSKFEDYCFKKVKINNFINFEDTNEIINDRFSEILIPSQNIKSQDKSKDLYMKINYLQLYYLLDYINKYIHLFDELSNLLDSIKANIDVFYFRQKTFDILYNINEYFTRSELGKQSFLSLLNNKYFTKIFMNFIEFISSVTEEIMEYEAHIILLMHIFFQIILSTENNSSYFLFLNKNIYVFLKKIIGNINTILDKKDSETVDNKLINNLNGLISLLKNLENTSIVNLMTDLKDNIYNNILKYNLNEKIPKNDEKYKGYIEEYKLLINKFNNDDMNYLGELNKNGTLINSIYLSIKLLDINFKINPILLIEGEGRHLHSILKYLIINTVNSFNYLLKKEMYKQEESSMNIELINIMINEENNNYNSMSSNAQIVNKSTSTILENDENIIILSNLLYHLYDILTLLLNNLLSSHVDNYRAEDIFDQLFLNINSCFNFLISFYALDEKIYKIGLNLYKKINAVQNLFNKCLELLHELCQFNTTIKLKFKDVIDKIFSVPENIPCQLFIVNFILNNNNNEFTIDHFIDTFIQTTEKININMLNNQNNNGLNNINFEETLMSEQIENVKNDPINLKVLLSHSDQKINNFIDYIIIIGISTNDDFLKQQCAYIILSIFHKFTLKGNIELFQEITNKIINEIKIQYENLSKINCLYFVDKDYDIYIPKNRNLLNCIKFINILISSDSKFLFIFQDISIYYINIFKYVQNYIFNKRESIDKYNVAYKNIKEEELSNYMYDIALLTLEGFKSLFNNKKNFEERYFFYNKVRYDLVEELPNMKQIKDILKELNTFLSIIKSISGMLLIDDKTSEKDNLCNKVLFLINKIFEIFLNLSTNVFGQNLLFENISLVDFNSELKKFENKNINKYLSFVIISLIKLTLGLFYDLDYYDYENKKEENEPKDKFVISQQRLIKLSKMYISSKTETNNEDISDKILPQLYEYNNLLIELLQNKKEVEYPGSALGLIQEMQNILKEYKKTIDVIILEKNSPSLPAMRQIQEKFEFIHVFNYFRQIQGVENECKLEFNNSGKIKNINYSEVISTLNGTANSVINYNQKPQSPNSEYNRNQINEFEKLLNWKKARIYMNEYDTLKIRNINFNIDSYVFSSEESLADFEFKFYQLKKKYLYLSNDPFEQYCNMIDYSLHIINQFKNISAFIYDTLCTKNYLFDKNEKYMGEILELFFKSNKNDAINLEELHNLEMEIKKYKNINENSGSSNKIKKKIKSKINKFIYKQRYDKQQNNNMSQLRLTTLMKQQDLQRFSSKVSGRNLSTHVDNVNPEKKVVNLTYNAFNSNSATANSIPPNNLGLQNTNSGLSTAGNPTGNGQIIIGDTNINNNLQNIPNQNDVNQINNNINYNMINGQNGININQNNNQINLVGQQNDVRQQNSNIKNIPQVNNLNNNGTPINNIINMSTNNVSNIPGNNNMINLNTPNNIQKNPITINTLLNNIKSPTNNNQPSQMLMINSPQINLQDRNKAININTLPNNMAPNIQNPNISNINPLNFNKINNPNLTHIPQNTQGIPPSNQNIIQGLQQNNNNLPVMNYLNPIPNQLINIPNMNQIIPNGQNYQNIPGQINNIGINQLNSPNNINNNQFQNQFNPNLIPQISPQTSSQQPILNKEESSGNLNTNNNNNHNSRSQQPKKTNLMEQIQGMLQKINKATSSSAKDPRKNRKK